MEAERPAALAAGRSNKAKKERGRMLGADHLASAHGEVSRKIATATYREAEEWYEQGGEEEGAVVEGGGCREGG